ncbi:hypothetical protein LGH83_04715 [Lichenihabitans sp. PAMC28606]|uniref:DUF6894 family protein n=1 Tax=Lichenihabitans sp. PAMC28606 TaxID=2880932 RepID=UPI001D0B932A|nr:hypothetical protein [Lichenihabitans sp. PAMC28606]UDL95529.1 hypothetical protein LGH83_04715 [Lichenihabitans sp. PAMC28606]
MPRFHFNVYDGVTRIDQEGIQLDDLKTARANGIRLAGALLAEKADEDPACSDWWLEITDGRGMILYRVDIGVSESAAIPR